MLALLTRPLSAGAANGAGLDWRTAEAALYCVRSVNRWVANPHCSTLSFRLNKTALVYAHTRSTQMLGICRSHAWCRCAVCYRLRCRTGQPPGTCVQMTPPSWIASKHHAARVYAFPARSPSHNSLTV